MAPSPVLALIEHFAHLDDPRVERTRLHQLLDMVVIAICAVIAGAESWDDIALFGEAKRARASDLSRVAQRDSLARPLQPGLCRLGPRPVSGRLCPPLSRPRCRRSPHK